MHLAAFTGNPDMIQLLIDAGDTRSLCWFVNPPGLRGFFRCSNRCKLLELRHLQRDGFSQGMAATLAPAAADRMAACRYDQSPRLAWLMSLGSIKPNCRSTPQQTSSMISVRTSTRRNTPTRCSFHQPDSWVQPVRNSELVRQRQRRSETAASATVRNSEPVRQRQRRR